MRVLTILVVLIWALGAGFGCEDDTMERTGENIDDAVDDAGDAMEDAVDETEDALDDDLDN